MKAKGDENDLNRSLRIEGLSKALGFSRVIAQNAGGRTIIEYRAGPEMCHSGGTIVHGGFVTGWIDQAMAFAAMAGSDYQFSPLTLEIKVSFLRSARQGVVIAEGWIERQGRSTVFLEGLLRDEVGEVLAKASSTARLVAARPHA